MNVPIRGMVRVQVFAPLNDVWHVHGQFGNLARVRADVFVIEFRLANEGLDY